MSTWSVWTTVNGLSVLIAEDLSKEQAQGLVNYRCRYCADYDAVVKKDD